MQVLKGMKLMHLSSVAQTEPISEREDIDNDIDIDIDIFVNCNWVDIRWQ